MTRWVLIWAKDKRRPATLVPQQQGGAQPLWLYYQTNTRRIKSDSPVIKLFTSQTLCIPTVAGTIGPKKSAATPFPNKASLKEQELSIRSRQLGYQNVSLGPAGRGGD